MSNIRRIATVDFTFCGDHFVSEIGTSFDFEGKSSARFETKLSNDDFKVAVGKYLDTHLGYVDIFSTVIRDWKEDDKYNPPSHGCDELLTKELHDEN